MTEMELMAECARLKQLDLRWNEHKLKLEELVKKWLETHDELPKWW